MTRGVLNILLVDDEAYARLRLREVLGDLQAVCPTCIAGEAENGVSALAMLQELESVGIGVDLILSDIHMPDMDGLELAGHLSTLPAAPLVVFTTAYDSYAVSAFELEAIDYLLKPVRAQRLLSALEKAKQRLPVPGSQRNELHQLGRQVRGGGRGYLPSHVRGRLLLVPVAEIIYFRAELKYVLARTAREEFLLEESLNHLEEEFSGRYVRLHRSVLVARDFLVGFERAAEHEEAYGWALLRGVSERLPVSRRQWSVVKELGGFEKRG